MFSRRTSIPRSGGGHRARPVVSHRSRLTLLTALLALPAPLSFAEDAPVPNTIRNADEVVVLDKVEVTETRNDPRAPIAAAAAQLAEIPGTASLVDLSEVQRGRAANAEDMLAFQPGVFAQATSGNSANKISIRGSGLNTFYQGYSLGTKYLYDGLPVTGPGGTQEELLAVNSASYIEILNGPNAFNYASTSLGGAINFVTHTGYTAPDFRTRIEAGSFGYRRAELSYGGVSGKNDYFVSVSRNERDGFQQNTPNEGSSFLFNVGRRLNDRLETRLIFRFQREELRNGSTLSKDQIDEDPSQNRTPGAAVPASPGVPAVAAQSARKKQGTTVVASKTTYTFDDDSKLEFGLANNNYPLENGWLYSNAPQDWRSNDVNVTLRYLREDEILGRTSKTTAIFSDTRLVFGDVHGYRDLRNGTPRTLTQYTDFSGSRDTVFALGNDFELIDDRVWLTSGLSYTELDRNVRIRYSTLPNTPATNPAGYPDHQSFVDRSFLPRVGLRYAPIKDVQLFGSVSKAVDAPVTWQMGSTGSPFIRPLTPQEATTVETGVRAKWKIFDGSLTFYRASIDDELLTIQVGDYPPGDPRGVLNANASATIHQGIEAALTTNFWETSAGDKISLRQSYTLNDFYYENDPQFGGNQLPGIPVHSYQVELLYQHAKGFYAGVNVRYASNYYVDFANTLSADAYAVLGAKIGYETERWQLFLDFRNLTDEHYATATNTAFNAAGNEASAFNFYPGDGFNVTGGIALRF